MVLLGSRRRRLAGAEHGSRVSQFALDLHSVRVRAAEHAPSDPFRVLERRHGLAEIVERGVGVLGGQRHRLEHPLVLARD